MSIFNNPWVIGIGGGILSGFIVTFASRALLSRRDRREYIQKVLLANREVIYAIRPGISEGHIPDGEVINALINATSRKYGIDKKDAYELDEVAEELIKEVMDSSFISAKIKEDYCENLATLSRPRSSEKITPEQAIITIEKVKSTSSYLEYRSRTIQMVSIMMGLLAAMMTIILAFSKGDVFNDTFFLKKENIALLLPMLATLLAVLLTTMAMYVSRNLLKKNLERKIEKVKDDLSKKKE